MKIKEKMNEKCGKNEWKIKMENKWMMKKENGKKH